MKKLFFMLCFGAHVNITIAALECKLVDAYKNNDFVTVEKLLKNPNIDINQVDRNGESLFLVACKERDFRLVEDLLKRLDVDVNCAGIDGETALLVACKEHDLIFVKNLLQRHDIDVNRQDNDGETPLLVACKNNGCNLNLGIIDALLKNGAVNKPNKKGETPLGVTKNTPLYGLLEYHFTGVCSESEWNSYARKDWDKQ